MTDDLRAAVADEAWVGALLAAERALLLVQHGETLPVPSIDAEQLLREARADGNPVIPLVRRLRELAPDVHDGATSQDMLDTAAALVARDACALISREVDGAAALCADLADQHRKTVMPARTLLQQATPTTFGLVAATWLTMLLDVRELPSLPAQLGGPAGTFASAEPFASELGLAAAALPWHANRLPLLRLGAALAAVAGASAKIALDVQLLSQTEVGEVREAHPGGSSAMPHKQNPVASTLARACARTAQAAAAQLVTGAGEHELQRAAGAWHAEWVALSDALAYAGSAAAWVRAALDGLEVDAGRMRANLSVPDDGVGAAGELIDRALEAYRG